jgi:hypothetical protein
MANRYTPLWIDPFENKLYSGWQNTQTAPTLIFKQGDKVDVEMFLVKKGALTNTQETVEFPSGCTVRLAIGKIDTAPTAGKMVLSYGGDSTDPLSYNSSASQIQVALNALASITAAGGVTVSATSTTRIVITFNSVGARTDFSVDASGLLPSSTSRVINVRSGSATEVAISILKIYQSVCVYQGSWDDSPEPTISVTDLVANQSKRVTIYPSPLSGTWTLTTTPNLVALVDAAGGDTTDLPTWWTEVTTQRLGAYSPSFQDGTSTDIWNFDVIQTDSFSWDFTIKADYAPPTGWVMPFTVSGNFTGFPSKMATLNFDTLEVEYLLNGASTATAVLEVEIEKSNGDKWTVLQTTCTIVNDLIDQDEYSPISFNNNHITEAPVDGTPYLRKDGAWSSDIDGGTY